MRTRQASSLRSPLYVRERKLTTQDQPYDRWITTSRYPVERWQHHSNEKEIYLNVDRIKSTGVSKSINKKLTRNSAPRCRSTHTCVPQLHEATSQLHINKYQSHSSIINTDADIAVTRRLNIGNYAGSRPPTDRRVGSDPPALQHHSSLPFFPRPTPTPAPIPSQPPRTCIHRHRKPQADSQQQHSQPQAPPRAHQATSNHTISGRVRPPRIVHETHSRPSADISQPAHPLHTPRPAPPHRPCHPTGPGTRH